MNPPDIRQRVAGTLFVTQAAVSEASATPLRIDVVAYRS
jgi:hypothetical protein